MIEAARCEALVTQMTLDEKLTFLHGAIDPASLGQAGYIPGVPRLGIPELRLADGPAGVRVTAHATALPAPVALASAFDSQLAWQYGEVIGRDGRALGQDVLLAPMVNTIRVPYGGRNFETFSEDPLVSSRTAAAVVSGIQSQGLIATVKHYTENNQEDNRTTVDVKVDEQTLQEIELPGFRAAVAAGAGSVMGAYNKVNGAPACGNSDLLNGILREQWGFTGWVMSDWGATPSADAITMGLDQEMPAGVHFGAPLRAAVQDGTIPLPAIDVAVTRILTQMGRFGLLAQDPAPRPARDPAGGAAVARRVAEQGAVLLRNTAGTLPLRGTAAMSIAVIGPTAQEPKVCGGGSAHVVPERADAPIDTIRARAGQGSTVTYTPGGDLVGTAIPASVFTPPLPTAADGMVALPDGAAYAGALTVTTAGEYRLTASSATGLAVVTLGGKSAFTSPAVGQTVLAMHLDKGDHPVTLTPLHGEPRVSLTWVTPERAQSLIAPAVAAARRAQTVIIFAYDDSAEGADRPCLSLPGYQDELIAQVAKANPDTVVVLHTGSSVTMPWLDDVRSVLEMWYPGQEGAHATTALLFGDTTPSGRLSQTFPASEEETPVVGDPKRYPGVDDGVEYSEGIQVGYRWYAANGVKPLFPFGYGLSYTTFSYGGLRAAPAHDDGLDISFTLCNTGTRAGQEVPQVYIGPSPNVAGPQAVRSLAGYEKISLAPGETKLVRIHVDAAALRYWNSAGRGWVRGTGTRTVWVGPSSADLPLRTDVAIR